MSDHTYEEAATELNVPVSWLQRKAQARLIPHRRYGRHVRFSDADIEAIRDKHAVGPMSVPSRTVIAMRRRAA